MDAFRHAKENNFYSSWKSFWMQVMTVKGIILVAKLSGHRKCLNVADFNPLALELDI